MTPVLLLQPFVLWTEKKTKLIVFVNPNILLLQNAHTKHTTTAFLNHCWFTPEKNHETSNKRSNGSYTFRSYSIDFKIQRYGCISRLYQMIFLRVSPYNRCLAMEIICRRRFISHLTLLIRVSLYSWPTRLVGVIVVTLNITMGVYRWVGHRYWGFECHHCVIPY